MNADWRARAGCRDIDPEIFYPQPTDGHGERLAKAICSHCPVLTACREYALGYEGARGVDMVYGVWGGLTPSERRRLILDARRPRQRVTT